MWLRQASTFYFGAFNIVSPLYYSPISAPDGWWNTPRWLQTALAGIWILALCFLGVALFGVRQHQQELQAIGREIVPEIIAAQRIKAGLSDMDATAANVLLLNHGAQQEQADDRYEARRVEVTESLASVLQGSNHSVAALQSVRTLATGLGVYENDVTIARLLHLNSQLGSRLVYRMTHSQMHDVLLPAADAFGKAGHDALEAAYGRQQAASRVTRVLCWLSGLLLLGALAATQVFLSRRMRRTLNPALLGATTLSLGLLFHTQSLFSQDAATLQAVKSSFASVSDLWQIRALAFDADAEESRWLMDTPQAPQYEQGYNTQSALILSTAAGQPYKASPGDPVQASLPNDSKGILANMIRADVSDEARKASQEMLQTYLAFTDTDTRLRALEQSEKHGSAVAFCVGRQPGQHDWAFAQFDAALGKLLGKEQRTFDTTIAEGTDRFANYNGLALLFILIAAILSGFALRTRLQEYAF